jgi:citrate lyase subunit beta / citryl-CoA lyase
MLRSYLYVPGDQPARITKALNLQGEDRPDAIIIDLEDAVAASQKLVARAAAAALTAAPLTAGSSAIFVRINAGVLDDVRAVMGPSLAGIVIPKASIASVAEIGEIAKLTDRNVSLVALIETAVGLAAVNEIAALPGVTTLAIGEADLGSELGISSDAHQAWWPLRMNLVVASGAAEREPPTGPVSTEFRNLAEFAQATRDLRDSGFGARPAIHPAQVAVINAIMKPSMADVKHARTRVERYDANLAAGIGVTTDEDGRMIDEAVIRRFRRMLQ